MIGRTVSHYRIRELIGRGGSSDVYLADDLALERQVVIKFLSPLRRSDATAERRLVAEAKALSMLDHPNVGAIHEVDQDQGQAGQLFLVMAYHTGGSLKNLLAAGRLDIARALELMIQILDGLGAAHARGIVHRDLKPANVMLAGDGTARIIDFGLARLADQVTMTQAGSLLGTVAYMSPEQANGERIDERSDLFSVGVMLFEMLTGHLPFPGENEAAVVFSLISGKPQTLSAHLDEIPSGLQQVVDRALAKDANDRYQTVTEMRDDLIRVCDRYSRGVGITTRCVTLYRRWRRRLVQRRAAAALVVLAPLAAIGYLTTQPETLEPRSFLVLPGGAGELATIQAAINAAAPGDTILLADGVFTGKGNRDLRYDGKAIVVRSESDDPTQCIIDCQGSAETKHVGVIFEGRETRRSVLRGITITNGFSSYHGGAVRIAFSSPTIENCRFLNNQVDAGRNAEVGGAIHANFGSNPLLVDCVFEGNRAADAGGAVHFTNSSGRILRCDFRGNWALHGGGAIFCAASNPAIEQCRFSGNSCGTGHWGSALHFDRVESRSVVTGCTFSGDVAPDEVIFARRGATPTITSSLIAFNGPGRAVHTIGARITLECCNIFGNEGGDWVGVIADQRASAGNFSQDPLLCDSVGDGLAVHSSSPCLPESNECGVRVGVAAEGCQGGKRIDIPADRATIAEGLEAAAAGDTVLIAAGTWYEHDLELPAGVILRGATGNPSDVIIDARRTGRVLLCSHLEQGVHIADLTLTNAHIYSGRIVYRGGGLACFSSDVSLDNCILTTNQAHEGGGIYIEGASEVRITRCRFEKNQANYVGGGMSCRGGARPLVTDCTFIDNSARDNGGALFSMASRPVVSRCTMRGNSAPSGAATYSYLSASQFVYCLLVGNSVLDEARVDDDSGGVLQFRSDRGGMLVNCTITGNQAGAGSGTVLIRDGVLAMTGTIVHGSTSGRAVLLDSSGTVDLNCCNLFGNRDGDYTAELAGFAGTARNIGADPLFVSAAAGDYRLRAQSPCAGADQSTCGVIGALPVVAVETYIATE